MSIITKQEEVKKAHCQIMEDFREAIELMLRYWEKIEDWETIMEFIKVVYEWDRKHSSSIAVNRKMEGKDVKE